MTLRVKALLAAGAAAILVATFLAGRYSNRAKVTEEAEKKTVATTTSTTDEHKDVTADEVVDRRITHRKAPGRAAAPAPPSGICPECPAVDETVIEERIQKRLLDRGVTTTIASGSVTSEEHTRKVTEYSRPGWGASLLAGWKPQDPTLAPQVYQLQVDRRVVGTVWAGAWIQGERVEERWKVQAVGALVRLEF